MIWGYARCSTDESKQNIDRQIKELKAAGSLQVIAEFEHGDAIVKKELSLLLDSVKEGDTIITLEVSRISRSVKQLCDLIDFVQEKKICLKILNSITVDCRNGSLDPTAAAFVKISSVFAELELSIMRERVKSGIAAARERGTKLGRPKLRKDDIPPIFYKHYPSYKNGKFSISELSRICNLSRNTIYKYISMVEQK